MILVLIAGKVYIVIGILLSLISFFRKTKSYMFDNNLHSLYGRNTKCYDL